MIVVCDTSTISNLLQIRQIDLLRVLFSNVLITPAVRDELFIIPEQMDNVMRLDWVTVATPNNDVMITQLMEKLDIGEAESIALALEKNADYLLIDEYKGRQIADAYGIKIVGLLGVLIQAKQKNLITRVAPLIDELTKIGFRLDKSLILKVLTALGEKES